MRVLRVTKANMQLLIDLETRGVNTKEDGFARIVETLRSEGYMVNQQRQLVVWALCKQSKDISAEDLWLYSYAIQKISISTVYNTLNVLVQLGLVEKDVHDNGKMHYGIRRRRATRRPQ